MLGAVLGAKERDETGPVDSRAHGKQAWKRNANVRDRQLDDDPVQDSGEIPFATSVSESCSTRYCATLTGKVFVEFRAIDANSGSTTNGAYDYTVRGQMRQPQVTSVCEKVQTYQ